MLQSVWSGEFQVFGVRVVCHVLNDGQRIVEAESLNRLFAAQAEHGHEPTDKEFEAQAIAFAAWLKGDA